MKLTTRFQPFTEQGFFGAVQAAAGASWTTPPAQVRYLRTYLGDAEAGARTLLVEDPYVDRHYMQEYVGHYATVLRPIRSTATRIHFFASSLDEKSWTALLHRAADGEEARWSVEAELEDHYLGYVVVRPIPACPVGRTALRPYAQRSSRIYAPAETTHEVHLHGLTLRVAALPFQQQDEGLGACATTALWSALARTTRADGGRAVTPLEVARATPGAQGQLVAAPMGLDLADMKGIIRSLGYEPHVFQPSEWDTFLLAIKCYVRAGIPVVLRLRMDDGEVHAATVAGLREADDGEFARDLTFGVTTASGNEITARATGLTRLYLHDDRLGPYGRFRFVAPTEEEVREAAEHEVAVNDYIQFSPGRDGFERYLGRTRIESALAPLYPKIRLTAMGLMECAVSYLPIAAGLAASRRDELRFEPFFALGGTYLAQLGDVLDDVARLTQIRREALLSRYVGVLRFFLGEEWMLDLVLDTTDVARSKDESSPVLLATGHENSIASLRGLEEFANSLVA